MFNVYADFEKEKLICRDCIIGKIYDTVVPSCGCKTNPKIIVVGEAPGKDEVELLEPFIGKAGQLLRSVFKKYGFRRSNSLITNVIPCRPENNKFPQDFELIKNCFEKWLKNEILILKPSHMLLLGSQSLKYILGLESITRARGQLYEYELKELDYKIQCMPTFHPSYVLRKQYMEEGKQISSDFENDIREVAKRAGLI